MKRSIKPAHSTPVQATTISFRSKAALAVVAALTALPSIAHAQASNHAEVKAHPEVKAWFDKAWANAAQLPDLGNHKFTWRLSEHSKSRIPLTEPAADELSRNPQPKNLPDIVISERTALSLSDDAWRFNLTWLDSKYFVDHVNTPDATWSLTGNALKIFDPKLRNSPDPIHGISAWSNTFRLDLSNHLSGGMAIGAVSQLTNLHFTTQEDAKWKCLASKVVQGDRTYEVEFSGHWLPAERRGRTDSIRVTYNSYVPANVGHTTYFHDYRYDASTQLDVAYRVESFDSAGALFTVSQAVGIEPLSSGGFEAATQIPSGTDALRGQLTIQETLDFKRLVQINTASGIESEITLPEPPSDPYDISHYRLYGYSTLAGCVLLLGFLKFRNKK